VQQISIKCMQPDSLRGCAGCIRVDSDSDDKAAAELMRFLSAFSGKRK